MGRIRTLFWIASWAVAGCTVSHDVLAPAGLDSDPVPAASTLSRRCQDMVDKAFDGMPAELECAGLFSNVAEQTLMAGVIEYAPSVALWSDGASKKRWIKLPDGEQIDTSDNAYWLYPVGTQFFKEFGTDQTGAIETRMFVKVRDNFWRSTTYVWNDDHTAATRDDKGKEVDVGDGKVHIIPSQRQCELCHGSGERVLGFEAVSLGTEGAGGLPLSKLVEDDLVTVPPPSVDLQVGDDGTGKAEPVIRWLHINCGRPCHNDDQNSEAYSTGLRLKLDPAQLDGRPVNEFTAVKSTMGVMAKTTQWANQTRIVPGDPDNSLLYKLISSRNEGKNNQMPPIASKQIDEEHVAMVRDWILSMKPLDEANDSSEAETD